jgi:hypothetical protein
MKLQVISDTETTSVTHTDTAMPSKQQQNAHVERSHGTFL